MLILILILIEFQSGSTHVLPLRCHSRLLCTNEQPAIWWTPMLCIHRSNGSYTDKKEETAKKKLQACIIRPSNEKKQMILMIIAPL